MIADVLIFLHPVAAPLSSWELVDDDPRGPRISSWNLSEPQPTPEEIAAVEASEGFKSWLLERAKAAKIAEIDARSAELIARGVHVDDGANLPLSLTAQQNLTHIATAMGMQVPVLPRRVSRMDGRSYVIPDLMDCLRIAALVRDTINGITDAGAALREAVLDATNQAEVDAVVDERQ